jgi:L-2-hydroxyglutarate oxidase LhgO
MAGREVVVLEAEDAIGAHTSSRNSEIIHAGIYYPQGSLKARTCVEGRERLYSYCAERGAMLALKSSLEKGVVRTSGIELHVAGAEPILAAEVVNSAGLLEVR